MWKKVMWPHASRFYKLYFTLLLGQTQATSIRLSCLVLIHYRSMLWKISVIVMHQFVLVAAVVHKQRFTGGPPDLSIHCVNFNYRVNTVGCARGLSTHATYNYAFLMHDGNCFQCRVVDVNGTSTDEVPLRGPQFFTGERLALSPSQYFNR